MESFLWSKSVASKDSMLRKVVPLVEPIVELGLEVGLAGAVTGSNSTKLRIENFFLICVIFVFSPCWLTLSMLFLALKFGFSWRSGRCSSSPLVTSSSSVMTPGCCSSLFRSPGIRVVLSIWVSRPTVATYTNLSSFDRLKRIEDENGGSYRWYLMESKEGKQTKQLLPKL